MAVNFITYDEKRHKVARPVKTREEYISLRDNETNRRAEKTHLVQFNYSLVSGGGQFPLRGAKTVGNSVGMDIDHIEDVDAMAASVLEKKDEVGLLMLEKSISGKGLHLVFRRHAEMSNEENLQWASNVLGVKFDKGAKDVTRVFFTPSSDYLLYLDDEIFLSENLNPDLNLNCKEGAKNGESLDLNNNKEGETLNLDPKAEDKADVYNKEDANIENNEAASEVKVNVKVDSPSYLGIPYSVIIHQYWDMYYEGHEPMKSNRDTLTYELANVMKHICGYDRELMASVIPCYDGFTETEKMKCIDSALGGKRTQMPKRLREVLNALRQQMMINSGDSNEIIDALDDALTQDELFFYNRIPDSVLVQGVKDSIEAAGQMLSMPIITAICPAIGARATGVQLVVHSKPNNLNLISYIAGDFASGKGQIDDVVNAWMSEDIAMAEIYNQEWADYAEKKKQCKNKKEQPVEPKLPKKYLTLNNTTANLAEELCNVQGQHAFSFTPEADVVSQKWKTSICDFSTMLRQSYDGSSYDREARSVEAVNVHIPHLLWNVVMCGTPDALYRVVNNYTDGFQSRIAVARTPDNTFAALDERPAHLTGNQKEKIEQVSHLLPLMNGVIDLPLLEARGREWLEQIRLETMKNDDKVMARQRMRVCVTAQRMTCCLMLVAVCADLINEHGVNGAEERLKKNPLLWQQMLEKQQTQDFMDMFGLIADSLIDNAMYFFRDRIEAAFTSSTYIGSKSRRTRKGKNDSIYSRLSPIFTSTEAMNHSVAVKGVNATQSSVIQMLKNWQNQGLIEQIETGRFRKIN